MKRLVIVLMALFIVFSLSACGQELEEGACSADAVALYEDTLAWWDLVAENVTTYGTYEVYLQNYRQPAVSWRAFDPVTTCDGALVDLMLTYISMDPENEKIETTFSSVMLFDVESTHVGE
ncbi:hypothetical protein KQH61_03665 [bacterium]|nr:hypothetical protein [bacterium]MCB2178999.1 hypothetical protein [bacterium]